MQHKPTWLSVILTVFIIWMTRNVAILTHEYAHSVTAWLFGLHAGPFQIHYGDWTLLNVYAVDTEGFYAKLFAGGKHGLAGLIAIVGPCVNLLMMLICLGLLALTRGFWLRWTIFWLAITNLSSVYSYIPTRVFSSSGDIYYFLQAFSLSPYLLLLPVIPALYLTLHILCRHYLPSILSGYSLNIYRVTLLFTLFIVFAWGSFASVFYYGLDDIRSLSFPLSVLVGIGLIWSWWHNVKNDSFSC